MGEPLNAPKVTPRQIVLGAAAWLLLAWSLVALIDVLDIAGIRSSITHPAWRHLFNNRPTEWLQWGFLAASVLSAGYLAGRLRSLEHRRLAQFLTILGAGLALMLLEEAGDIRHGLYLYTNRFSDAEGEIFGIHSRVVNDAPYFALLAVLPLVALLRHWRDVFALPGTRGYLIGAYGLYGIAAASSAIRHFEGFYISVGAALHRALGGAPGLLDPDLETSRNHFMLIDSPVEESVELLAAAFMLALIVAIAHAVATQARDTSAPTHESAASPPPATDT